MTQTVLVLTLLLSAFSTLSGTKCPPEGCPANTDETDDIELLQNRVEVGSSMEVEDSMDYAAKQRSKMLADRLYYGSFMDATKTRYFKSVPIFNAHQMLGGMAPSQFELDASITLIADFTDPTAMHTFCTDLEADANTCDCNAQGDSISVAIITCSQSEFDAFIKAEEAAGNPLPTFTEPNVEMAAFPVKPGVPNDAALLQTKGATNVWGIDRVDSTATMDGTYSAWSGSNEGVNAHVYVADTGINIAHNDFGGRGGRAKAAVEFVRGNGRPKVCSADDVNCAADGNGHGTHCAGTVGGTTYGVAKQTNLYAVKVLRDSGSGSSADIIESIDWVVTNGNKPAVWSASLGGSGTHASYIQAFDNAIINDVVISVAAGNSNDDACGYSPAFAPSAITVGATDSADRRSSFSNYGSCLDVWAPGTDIKSTWYRSATSTNTISGTSMACPHVSGALALFLSEMSNPPAERAIEAENLMKSIAIGGEISDIKAGSPDLFLYTGGATSPLVPGEDPTPAPAPAPAPGRPISGGPLKRRRR